MKLRPLALLMALSWLPSLAASAQERSVDAVGVRVRRLFDEGQHARAMRALQGLLQGGGADPTLAGEITAERLEAGPSNEWRSNEGWWNEARTRELATFLLQLPFDAQPPGPRAWALFLLDRREEARIAASELGDGWRYFHRFAALACQEGDLAAAENDLQTALRLRPHGARAPDVLRELAELHRDAAYLAHLRGRPLAALESFRALGDAGSADDLARLLLAAGQPAQAQQVLARQGSESNALDLAATALAAGQDESAESMLARVEEDSPRLRRLRAQVRARRGEVAAALELLTDDESVATRVLRAALRAEERRRPGLGRRLSRP